MDIPQVLAVLRPTDDWGPGAGTNSTYDALVAGWRGANAVPTLAEMQSQWDAIVAAAPGVLTQQQRAAADAFVTSDPSGQAKAGRAVALAGLDEINNLRSWLASFVAQVAAAASLADLKTRVAALPALPQRTKQQLLNVATGHVDSGDAD